jgi:hyaluronate lyase
VAPEPRRSYFKALASSWSEAVVHSADVVADVFVTVGMQQLKTEGFLPPSTSTGLNVLPMADRAMYHQLNWSAAISMSSIRTGRYETLNAENLQSFYQGDGFMQLYLANDKDHYINDYYPTMDPYHTPGVTAVQKRQKLAKYRTTAYNDWAGGVTWHDMGSASLKHLSNDRSSSAKKSWFFLVNAIIALGTQCIGGSGSALHTTYESRSLQMPGSRLLVNGRDYDGSSLPGWQSVFSEPSWAHLDGIAGYIFLDGGNVTFERANRTGRWTDIDKHSDYAQFDEQITREYLTIYRDHGVNPAADSYAYAIIPNASAVTTARLANEPEFHILANIPAVQAIELRDSNTFMATFWESGMVAKLTANTPCSVVWGYEGVGDRNYTITIADPSQKQRIMSLRLEEEDLGGVLHLDDGMSVIDNESNSTGIGIEINCLGSYGKTYKAVFERISWRGYPGKL